MSVNSKCGAKGWNFNWHGAAKLKGSKEAKNIAIDVSKFRKIKDNLIQNKFIRFIYTVMATRMPKQETKSFTKINWILGSEKESSEFQSMSSQFNFYTVIIYWPKI